MLLGLMRIYTYIDWDDTQKKDVEIVEKVDMSPNIPTGIEEGQIFVLDTLMLLHEEEGWQFISLANCNQIGIKAKYIYLLKKAV